MTEHANLSFSRAAALHNIEVAKGFKKREERLLAPYLTFLVLSTSLLAGLVYSSFDATEEKRQILLTIFAVMSIPYLAMVVALIMHPVRRINSYRKEIQKHKRFLAETEDTLHHHPIKLHKLHRTDDKGKR